MNRAGRPIAPVAVLAILLAACSTQNGDPVPGEDPRISEARDWATSDFEREVLADGEISDQEFQASRELFKTCMEEKGYGVSLGPIDNATTSIELKDPNMTEEQMDADWDRCSIGTTKVVEGIFSLIRENPTNEDRIQLLVDCMVRNELVPAGYTKADLDNLSNEIRTLAFRGCSDDPRNYVATEQDKSTPLEGLVLDTSTE